MRRIKNNKNDNKKIDDFSVMKLDTTTVPYTLI